MYQEVITIKGWVDGSGWSYEQEYGRNTVEEIPETLEVSDVWEKPEEQQQDGDIQIIVSYYDEDDEDCEEAIKTFKFWESDLFEG